MCVYQGVFTKVAQAVAYGLGVPIDMIRVTSTSTAKIPNMTMTGGSGTSETHCKAAINACTVRSAVAVRL